MSKTQGFPTTVPMPVFLVACAIIVVLVVLLFVRGCAPRPDPDPKPPTPTKDTTVFVVHETAHMPSLPSGQQHLIASLAAREQVERYVKFMVVDYDIATGTNTVYNLPNAVLAAIKAVPKTALPFMLMVDKDGKVAGPYVLPQNVDEMVAVVSGKTRPKPLRISDYIPEPPPDPECSECVDTGRVFPAPAERPRRVFRLFRLFHR